jgi:hypothetical protein
LAWSHTFGVRVVIWLYTAPRRTCRGWAGVRFTLAGSRPGERKGPESEQRRQLFLRHSQRKIRALGRKTCRSPRVGQDSWRICGADCETQRGNASCRQGHRTARRLPSGCPLSPSPRRSVHSETQRSGCTVLGGRPRAKGGSATMLSPPCRFCAAPRGSHECALKKKRNTNRKNHQWNRQCRWLPTNRRPETDYVRVCQTGGCDALRT